MKPSFFPAPLAYARRRTRVVHVGKIPLGGAEPIRIQSMLTSNTWDVEKVMVEMHALAEAGCEIIRLTVPTEKDLKALPEIRKRMEAEGLDVPLVADIHFNPRLALGVVPYVEKVRINPGNYVDAKRGEVREYTEEEYAAEVARVEQAVKELVGELKKHGRALRVGVNHGSLADRIFNRFGDTPEGMVESAMEFLRVLAAEGFHDVIVSMKSSNPLVVIQAYKMLALTMESEGMDYPLHLGVTEAGDGTEGRIKSAVGIGALLADGLGDTVRVSLTEPAAHEIPAARELVGALEGLQKAPAWPGLNRKTPFGFARRSTQKVALGKIKLGGGAQVALVHLLEGNRERDRDRDTDTLKTTDEPNENFDDAWGRENLPQLSETLEQKGELTPVQAIMIPAAEVERCAELDESRFPSGALLVVSGPHPLYAVRRLVVLLEEKKRLWPLGVIVPPQKEGAPSLALAAEIGALVAEGLIDVLLSTGGDITGEDATGAYCRTLMQASRARVYATDYISCPSCGRTLFDLQDTTARIKSRTQHLKGLKIAIMGCIVNGPGEMADADFGYVGGAPGKINLYHGRECVERGVPTDEAVEKLVGLIQSSGRWVDPP